MANLNYAEQWSPELLEILIQGALTSPFITTNVKWLNANTFHFTQMSVSGYRNHKRSGGWNSGTFSQTDHPYTVTHDRDVQFLVDKADVDETNATASINNISKTFEKTAVVPETDALFFYRVAKKDIIHQQLQQRIPRQRYSVCSRIFLVRASSADIRQEAHLSCMSQVR